MPCLNTFCCGYNLRSGGSFIGYVSIIIYLLLNVLCVIVLWSIKLRIDDAGISGRGWNVLDRFSSFIRTRADDYEIEETLQDLKSWVAFYISNFMSLNFPLQFSASSYSSIVSSYFSVWSLRLI